MRLKENTEYYKIDFVALHSICEMNVKSYFSFEQKFRIRRYWRYVPSYSFVIYVTI